MNKKLYKIALGLADNIQSVKFGVIYPNLMSLYTINREYFSNFTPNEMLIISLYIYSIKNKKTKEWADDLIGKTKIVSTFTFDEESFEEEECPDCDGNGSISCDRCYGNGEEECRECDGSGIVECPTCDGEGDDEEGNTCPECQGEGQIDCNECDEGRNQCSVCGGDGSETCGECGGNAYTLTEKNKLDFFTYLLINKKNNQEFFEAYELGKPIDLEYFDDKATLLPLWSGEIGYEVTDNRDVLETDKTYCNMFENLTSAKLKFVDFGLSRPSITFFQNEMPEQFLK